MFFNIRRRVNPQNRKEYSYYAAPEYGENIDIRTLATEISKSCSLSVGDVIAVLESFIDKLPFYLKASCKVELGGFGRMRLSFSSEGHKKAEDVSYKDIGEPRIIFTPGTALKRELSNVSYSRRGVIEEGSGDKEKKSAEGAGKTAVAESKSEGKAAPEKEASS